MSLDLTLLPDHVAICRLPAKSALPAWAASGGLSSVSWTEDATSVVCPEAVVPSDVQSDGGWRAFMVAGPLDFSLTGILLSIARPLAEAGIAIFAISTYDTDYVLVKESSLQTAIEALSKFGHRVI